MTVLDDLNEVVVADLPGQDRPEPPVQSSTFRHPTNCLPAGIDENFLQKWRSAVDQELRARAIKCLTETFDQKNNFHGNGSSPAFRTARTEFVARVENADHATLFQMIKWAPPEKARWVFDTFTAIAEQFAPDAGSDPTRRNRQRAG